MEAKPRRRQPRADRTRHQLLLPPSERCLALAAPGGQAATTSPILDYATRLRRGQRILPKAAVRIFSSFRLRPAADMSASGGMNEGKVTRQRLAGGYTAPLERTPSPGGEIGRRVSLRFWWE